MPWYIYPLIVLAGVAGGFVNVLAGNGSLIMLPALIFAGLPANVANGTNRIGILLQNVVGVAGFQQQKKLDWRGGLWLSIPATLGSIVGAQIAVDINRTVFERVLAVAMIAMLVLMFLKPERWIKGHAQATVRGMTVVKFLVFFAIGIYGGFLQAGVGVFLLAGLVLSAGYDIVRANAVKLVIVLVYTVAALAIFWANAQVEWGIGLLLAVGSMIGAWLATRFAADKGAVWVRRFVIVVVLLSAAQLLGVLQWAGRLLGL
jgi:uncharacterized membrane protein YfcA